MKRAAWVLVFFFAIGFSLPGLVSGDTDSVQKTEKSGSATVSAGDEKQLDRIIRSYEQKEITWQRKLDSLEQKVVVLQQVQEQLLRNNEVVRQEIKRLEMLLEKRNDPEGSAPRGKEPIESVKRLTGGRPAAKDMMVSPVQLNEVWKQLDMIMDKLDEISSERFR